MPKLCPRNICSRQSSGYTLIELLIVITIAVLLMVITLPVAKSVMEDARPREASRIFNTTITTAKSRAAQTGRLAGIEFVMQRMNDPTAAQAAYQCTQMYMCEVPALYAGDTTTAVATVDQSSDPMLIPFYTLAFQDQIPAPSGMPSAPRPVYPDSTTSTAYMLTDQNPYQTGMTTPGPEDVFEIRFDHRGPWYFARRNPAMANQFQIRLTNIFPAGAMSNFTASSFRYSTFQIRRPPVRVGNPVELPKSTAIDMTYSGTGPDSDMVFPTMAPKIGLGPTGMEFATATGLRMMVAPSGSVESITMSYLVPGGTSAVLDGAPPGTLHFLVGLTNKINTMQTGGTWTAFDQTQSNLADANALWVSIGRSSGIVTTNENAPGVPNPTTALQRTAYTQSCRQYATAREQKGGR